VATSVPQSRLGKEESFSRNFRDVRETLEHSGIKFWLDYGSLLGAVRDGGMIKWDPDMDFGTVDECWDDLTRVIPKLQELGFCGYTTNIPVGNGLFSRGLWIRRYGQKVDIMVYQRVKRAMLGFVWTRKESHHLLGPSFLSKIIRYGYFLIFNEQLFGTSHPSELDSKASTIYSVLGTLLALISLPFKYARKFILQMLTIAGFRFAIFSIPSHFFERLSTIKVYGVVCNAPSDVEKYLRYHYGDWRKPKKKFDWTVDDGAVVGYI
jgi:hypothetical protein